MARLKVKQIVDFDSAVAAAIASNDTNDAASITSLATAIASEQSLQDASINSLELEVQGGTGALGDSVDSLESAVSAVASDLSSYEGDTDDSIHSLESIDAGLASAISVETSRINVILGGASAEYDTFVEIYNLITDIDSVNDSAFSTYVVTNNQSIHSLESVDASIVKDLSDYISLNDSSIHSLETVDGTLGESVDSLESAVSAVASDLSDYESATDVSINSLEAVDGTLAASVDSLETLAGEAFGSGLRVHQMGTIISATEFTLPSAVDAGANSDIVVFVNGKNEQMFGVNGNSNGWSTPDGQNFTFTGIGYNLDLPGVNELGDDEVYVIAPLAGNGAGSGVDTGDYNDFEAAR